MVVEKEGYVRRQTPPFFIQNVVNETVELISSTTSLSTIGQAGLQSLEDAAGRALDALGVNGLLGSAFFTWQQFDEWADNPTVEETIDTYVAPATVLVPTVAIVPALSGTAIPAMQYAFQYIFLQPLLLFRKKKKRKQWGTVYNSLTKMPVDLAIVRLLSATTKKVVQSRVTDGQGRFFFFAKPGDYILDVRKPTFVYPSDVMRGAKTDGDLLDIYHGETIAVTLEDSDITPNIPIDPPDANTKTVKQIKHHNVWQILQQAISLSSISLAAIAYYITPSLKVAVILCVHIAIYAAFMIYLIPTKPKGWGIVYDTSNKKPISRAVARLFSVQYNKLIDTQITDRKGRYAFLVGPSVYRVVVEREAYARAETSPLSLEHASDNELLIKPNIPLSPKKKA